MYCFVIGQSSFDFSLFLFPVLLLSCFKYFLGWNLCGRMRNLRGTSSRDGEYQDTFDSSQWEGWERNHSRTGASHWVALVSARSQAWTSVLISFLLFCICIGLCLDFLNYHCEIAGCPTFSVQESSWLVIIPVSHHHGCLEAEPKTLLINSKDWN